MPDDDSRFQKQWKKMKEWHINSDLEYLHRVIDSAMNGTVSVTPVFLRMFRLGVLSLIQSINIDLSQMDEDLDVSVMLEGTSIDFDRYLNMKFWERNFLLDDGVNLYKAVGIDVNKLTFQREINLLIDYFPTYCEDYHFTQDMIDTFKKSMHQLCDMDKLGNREVIFALHFGLSYMVTLLTRIKNKVEHPHPHQYIKVWEEIYEDSDTSGWGQSYDEWKEENENYKIDDLKRQHLYEIYKLLRTDFFRYYTSINGADVKKCRLRITEDDLPVGCTISDSLPIECAKFEKFFDWKDGYILRLNYEKMGQYIYKNYSKLELSDTRNIVAFDKTVEKINEDIAELKPNLKKHLKNYEENMVNELVKECSAILNTCQKYLDKSIRPTLLQEYLRKLLFDKDMKNEARNKLSGASRNTYMCEIVAALKNVNIFRVDCDKHDLARSLHEKITKVKEENISKYIERYYNDRKGTIYNWTKRIIDDLKEKTDNPFEGII